jgi:hypothetical protein
MRFQLCKLLAVFFAGAISPVLAAPFAEVGDSQLRADIAVLGNAGLADDFSGQWPLPWAPVLSALNETALAGASPDLRAAAARVWARDGSVRGFSASARIGTTNTPALVYDFGGLGRGEGQAQLLLAYDGASTFARLSLGAFTGDFTGRSLAFMPDGSFLAQKIGDEVIVYGGWLSHWWGPGWISSLTLSNNARPMPQIGIQRAGSASNWPVLNWLGPWQAEFFLGLMDDPRLDRNTVYNAAHFSFQPLPGLEIGLAHTQQICGENHSCAPLRAFDFNNSPGDVNTTNDEGEMDIRWTHKLFDIPVQLYMSLMNEDSSPVTHSGTSHLFGATVFLPMKSGSPVRLTLEYADSVATANIFSFGDVLHGVAYNNSGYSDGMRYRGRTLGFSLDSDSSLLSLQGSWSDSRGVFYELSFHSAHVSNPNNLVGNTITATPVRINLAEGRVSLPWQHLRLDLALRLQDDQPRPARGFDAGLEMVLRAPL